MITVFLTDDDADDREFFQEALSELSIETKLTNLMDGAELMNTLEETVLTEPPPPHVIFLDLNMPRKNGYECLKEIRNNQKLKNIPIIIFSTSANPDEINKTYNLGANCYIHKPNSHIDLMRAIETALTLDFWKNKSQLPREKFVLTNS